MKYRILILLMASGFYAYAQTGRIKGHITTSDHQPAAYVNVTIKNSTIGTITDALGDYELKKITAGNHTLVVSFVGLETKEVALSVSDDLTTLPVITLNETSHQLSEIVINSEKENKFAAKESDYVSKLSLRNLENPQVYTTISKELLKEQLTFSVDDAIKNAPGLQKMWEATGRSGDGGAYYNSRGFILQSQLRNGVAGNVSSRIDAANLERIEVIKGPSATLFGSTLTSYGGLINRVTKKPYETTGGEITYATGSYGFNRVSADINTPLDADKKVLFRANTAYNYEGTFQDNGFNKSLVIAPSLSYKVSDKLSFNFDAEFMNGSNTLKPIIFFYFPASQLGATRADQLGIDYKRSYSTSDVFQTSRNANFFGQMKYKLSDSWTSQTNVTSTHSFSDGPGAYYYLVPNSVVTGNAAATGADYLVRADQSTNNSSMDVVEIQQNFIGDFALGSMRNRLVAGVDVFAQNSNQYFYDINFDTIPKNGTIAAYGNFNRDKLTAAMQNGTPGVYPYKYKSNTYSAYASDVINLTERLIASAALRIDHFDNIGSYDQTTATYKGSYKQTALAPKFGLVYQLINNGASLFANYQNGFTNKTGTDYAGKAFKPEQANQWETGVKFDALAGRLTGTVSYYDIQVSNLVRPYPTNPNFSMQDGTQLSKGVEVEVIASPVTGFNVIAGFAHNNSKYTKASEDVNGRRPATAMSPNTANVWLSYKLTKGNVKGLGLGFGGNYASDNKILNSVSYGEFILPAYTVLNATVFYEQPKFRVGLKVDNLTNKEYWIGYTTMSPQKLRSITGSISFKF